MRLNHVHGHMPAGLMDDQMRGGLGVWFKLAPLLQDLVVARVSDYNLPSQRVSKSRFVQKTHAKHRNARLNPKMVNKQVDSRYIFI